VAVGGQLRARSIARTAPACYIPRIPAPVSRFRE